MTPTRLDDAAKAVARSRRAALRSGAALTLGGLLAAVAPRGAAGGKRKLKPAYVCGPANDNNGFGGNGVIRVARAFTALRSGTLRQITMGIVKDEGTTGDYLLQLVKMAGATPSTEQWDVLAAARFADAQVPKGNSTLKASFSTTKIAAGFPYAVVLTRFGASLSVQTRSAPDACPGQSFWNLGVAADQYAAVSLDSMTFSVLVS